MKIKNKIDTIDIISGDTLRVYITGKSLLIINRNKFYTDKNKMYNHAN